MVVQKEYTYKVSNLSLYFLSEKCVSIILVVTFMNILINILMNIWKEHTYT